METLWRGETTSLNPKEREMVNPKKTPTSSDDNRDLWRRDQRTNQSGKEMVKMTKIGTGGKNILGEIK